MKKYLLICLSMLTIMLSAVAQNSNKKMTATPVKTVYDAFKKDKGAAQKQYGGKIQTVTGYVTYVGPDLYALPSVEISEKAGGKARALVVLPFSDYLKLRKLKKGDFVTCTGELRAFYDEGDQVLLKQSTVVKK